MDFLTLPPGRRVLGWFGNLSFPDLNNRSSTPSITVCFADNGDDVLAPKAAPIERTVGIGYLPLLAMGMVFEGTTPAGSVPLETLVAGVDTTVGGVALMKAGCTDDRDDRAGPFLLPFDAFALHRGHTGAYCQILPILGDEADLIIPSVEILSRYFGSSSALLSRIVSRDDKDRIFGSWHTGDNASPPFVQLAPGIPVTSAFDVARVVFDNAARRAAFGVRPSLQRQALRGQRPYIQMSLPFQGFSELTVEGRWLPSAAGARRRFVVFRIKRCTHPFPVDALRCQTTRADEFTPKKAKRKRLAEATSNDPKAHSTKALASGLLSDAEPQKRSHGRPVEIELGPLFPDLISKPLYAYRETTVGAGDEEPEVSGRSTPNRAERGVGNSLEGKSKGPREMSDSEWAACREEVVALLANAREIIRSKVTNTNAVFRRIVSGEARLEIGVHVTSADSALMILCATTTIGCWAPCRPIAAASGANDDINWETAKGELRPTKQSTEFKPLLNFEAAMKAAADSLVL